MLHFNRPGRKTTGRTGWSGIRSMALVAIVTAASFGTDVGWAQTPGLASISVDPNKILGRVAPQVIGVNLEDLNYQVYGGLYSQLIDGESFQENIDSAVLGLKGTERLAVYVTENDAGELQLRAGRSANTVRQILGLKLQPEPPAGPPAEPGVFAMPHGPVPTVPLSELPPDMRAALLEAARPERRVSRQWRAIESGAEGTFGFERKSPFVGAQSQIVTFVKGVGDVGIENAGLNRWGINLVAGMPYEGLLRVRSATKTKLWVALLDGTGKKKLAEKALDIEPGTDYQRLEFTLTPRSSDKQGRFAVSLRAPGSVTLGYAFLQPGPWGRFKNLPVRLDLAQALIDQGVKVIRYDGSMVSGAVDGNLYKWKEMIGPRDLRKPYAGSFNPYSTNGFGIIDFLNFAEAAGVMAVPGIRIDETPEDMADFVEYVNGPASSKWGSRRVADGHPAPYNLTHLEIGNEHQMDDAYVERFELLAKSIWARDPKIVLLIANSLIGPGGRMSPEAARAVWEVGPAGEVSNQLKNAVRLIRFAQEEKGQVWWDQHYQAFPNDYEQTGSSPTIDIITTLRRSIDRLVPGNTLRVAALEENGATANMRRALVHARNLNAFFRLGQYVPAAGLADALEAAGQVLTWDQGVTVFTPSEVFHQPSYFVDQAVAQYWAANAVETTVHGPLDAQARTTDDGREIVLQVINDTSQPIETALRIEGIELGPAKPTTVVELTGPEEAVNSPEHPDRVRPTTRVWENWTGVARYTFPKHSVTLLRFER